jgi:hypothetical protein
MSIPAKPKPAKLVISCFLKNRSMILELTDSMVSMFGKLDVVSPWFPFDYTAYYEAEMGKPLYRRMLCFKDLINQDRIADIKQHTNEFENRFEIGGKRQVNIDPGYLSAERFVLATGKNFTHRIYLSKGIFADLTLIYTKGDFHTLPWTYPDYADLRMIRFLKIVREKYLLDLKHSKSKQSE